MPVAHREHGELHAANRGPKPPSRSLAPPVCQWRMVVFCGVRTGGAWEATWRCGGMVSRTTAQMKWAHPFSLLFFFFFFPLFFPPPLLVLREMASICAVVLLTISATSAQVASHAHQFSTRKRQPSNPLADGGASERDGAYGPRFAA